MSDLLQEKMPRIFRLVNCHFKQINPKEIHCEAMLFHEQASLRVTWTVQHLDVRLKAGCLVSIRWAGNACSEEGAVRIARLVLLEIPSKDLNLFDTVPNAWVSDRELVQRARALLDWLPQEFHYLLNAILWDGRRFHRFVVGPSSLNNHHAGKNGNFRHTVEVAERCLILAQMEPLVCRSVLVMSALLHDAGKADEYMYNRQRLCFEISARGALVGHRHTILEWIAAALAQQRIALSEMHHLALLHCLTAAKGGEFLGIRQPLSLEATILSAADRLSGQADLIFQNAPKHEGFGRYHKHFGGRPYVVGQMDTPALRQEHTPFLSGEVCLVGG